ncbi:MAG: zinc-ribbon domain-containing protein [Paludibacteraceae bacterium]|nr:zinc-ribbon domain-containing protein [Paludibacteraceae bacterium]
MALITCPECGKEISSSVSKCPHCGFEIQSSNKVTVLGYTETFAASPAVSILKDGVQIGEVKQSGKVELDINKECELQFKCNFRSTECVVKPGDWILLSFNRTTGKLTAIRTDKDNYQFAINEAKSSDGKRWLWAIIIGVILFVIGFLLSSCVKSSESSESTYEESYYESPKTLDDYNDIVCQAEICEKAKQRFLQEVDNVFYKASMPEYQGVMAQKIFWEANYALDDFNKEGEKLERLLRKHGFSDEAMAHKEARENLNQVYREEKRHAQGYR